MAIPASVLPTGCGSGLKISGIIEFRLLCFCLWRGVGVRKGAGKPVDSHLNKHPSLIFDPGLAAPQSP